MSYYIQTPGLDVNKAIRIAADNNGVIIPKPKRYTDIPEDKALVVVVVADTYVYEVAELVYSEGAFHEATDCMDERRKEYVLLDKPVAYRLADYPN